MDTTSYKTSYVKPQTVEKKWILVDAEGQTMGRLASRIALRLRGKHRPDYSPHVDCGDNVVVINAEKIQLSGKKWNQKTYETFSGYPGGRKVILARHLRDRKGERPLELAIKGMLPKSRLGRQCFRNLYVYAGADHPHGGQNPEPVELNV